MSTLVADVGSPRARPLSTPPRSEGEFSSDLRYFVLYGTLTLARLALSHESTTQPGAGRALGPPKRANRQPKRGMEDGPPPPLRDRPSRPQRPPPLLKVSRRSPWVIASDVTFAYLFARLSMSRSAQLDATLLTRPPARAAPCCPRRATARERRCDEHVGRGRGTCGEGRHLVP